MGCGKSSVGRELAKVLGWPLTDLDDLIENRERRKISDIFTNDGEAAFRTMELAALRYFFSSRHVSDTCPADRSSSEILSLGGGTVTSPECARLVREYSHCIYLKASVDTLVFNLTISPGDRPVLKNEEGDLRTKISGLLARREAAYKASATDILNIDGLDSVQITHEIITLINR